MKAVVIAKPGGPEVFEVRDVPAPEPQGDQVRVRVRACGLNRADLAQARGSYPAPAGVPPDIPGLEYAGEVEALGPSVTGPLRVGERVFGIVGGGGMAEYLVTPERTAVPIPAHLSFEEAAAVPEVFITAQDALENQAGVRPGERVLIHAVGSGVGTAACQLAHAIGCTVYGTSRSKSKLDFAAGLGLDVPIDTSSQDFAAVIRDHTGGAGVDVVLDLIGASVLEGNLAALAPRGRMVVIGLLGGGRTAMDLGLVLRKRITLVGTTLRARPIEEKIAVTRQFAARVVPWLSRGLARPILDRVFAFEDVRAAQERLESNLGVGKIVLRL
jgi:putative PIG3 family NAD(P)H quinone oxidoreductase